MDVQIFLDNFSAIAESPDGVQRLRKLVLNLAVRGQLTSRDESDDNIDELFTSIHRARESMIASGVVGKPRYTGEMATTEIPYDVPATWRWARLGDVGAVVGGGTPKSDEGRYWAEGEDIPWLTPADMRAQQSRFVRRGARDITSDGLAESSAQLLPTGSVLFSSRAPIGYVGIADQPLTTNQGFKSCVPYIDVMSEYLYVFLKQVGPSIDAAATGTTFKEVSGKDVALIPIPVPPLAEQKRIVAKVDELTNLCDQLEMRQDLRHRAVTQFRASTLHALTDAGTPDDLRQSLERVSDNWEVLTDRPESIGDLREAIRQLAVEGRLTSQDPKEEPAYVLLGACQERKLSLVQAGDIRGRSQLPEISSGDVSYPIPPGWAVARLDDWCELAGGVAKGRKLSGRQVVTLPYLRVANVKAGYLALDEIKLIDIPVDEISRYSLRAGDILLTEGGDWDKLGRSAVWTGEIDPCLHQNHVFRARPLCEGLLPEWISLYTNSEAGRRYFQSKAKRTTNLASINMTELRSTPLPVPPAAEQRRILERLAELEQLLFRVEAALTNAQSQAIKIADVLTRAG